MKKGNSYDTRFLVEYFYSPERERISKMKEILLQSRPNILSSAALSEIYGLMLRREGKHIAELRLKVLRQDFQIPTVDSLIAVQAAQIRHKHPIPFADSLIAATSKVLAVPCYTDDEHFRGIEGVKVQWFE